MYLLYEEREEGGLAGEHSNLLGPPFPLATLLAAKIPSAQDDLLLQAGIHLQKKGRLILLFLQAAIAWVSARNSSLPFYQFGL